MNQVCMITGASGGIGEQLAVLYAKKQYDLILVARSEEKLNALAADLFARYGVQVRVIPADLTDRAAVESVISSVTQLDVLVNNAGFGDYGAFVRADWKKLERMMELNMRALARLSYGLLPQLIVSEGKLINVASMASFMPGPYMSMYYATKAFVLSLTEGIAEEVRPKGVRVMAICPGPTKTGFVAAAGRGTEKLFHKLWNMEPATVAKIAIRGIEKGRVVIIPGILNKIMVESTRLAPRMVVRKIVRTIQK